MDMSMILGLTLAGFIVLINGNKKQPQKSPTRNSGPTELVVRLGDGNAVVSPKQ